MFFVCFKEALVFRVQKYYFSSDSKLLLEKFFCNAPLFYKTVTIFAKCMWQNPLLFQRLPPCFCRLPPIPPVRHRKGLQKAAAVFILPFKTVIRIYNIGLMARCPDLCDSFKMSSAYVL